MNIFNWLSKGLLPLKPDPRLDTFPLMSSWTPTALITLTYVIGVYAWKVECLKRYEKQLKNKEEFNSVMKNAKSLSNNLIKQLMILYNGIMVIYSAIISFSTMWAAYNLGYGLGCVELPDPNDANSDILVWIGYFFYFSKLIELLDTVFFLWRGKIDQVTFLHVFHHATMPPSIWWGVKYAPGGITFMFPLVNCLIHVAMYTYYGLAAAGAHHLLWWKNYLTIAQMIQFIIFILHQGQLFLPSTTCNYPKIFPAAIILYATVFLILFTNFYIKAYWHKQRLAKSLEKHQHYHHHDHGHHSHHQQQQNGRQQFHVMNGSMKQMNGYGTHMD
uniref:Elongation of very long chain fatty acids protein n=1 Tax=Schistosoma mansoni TaxID=6183 RepID=A0A3Q0KLN9_SCHMA